MYGMVVCEQSRSVCRYLLSIGKREFTYAPLNIILVLLG